MFNFMKDANNQPGSVMIGSSTFGRTGSVMIGSQYMLQQLGQIALPMVCLQQIQGVSL